MAEWILIPFLRTACELNDFQAYFVSDGFLHRILCDGSSDDPHSEKTGFKRGMSVGLWIMSRLPCFYTCCINQNLRTFPDRSLHNGNRPDSPSNSIESIYYDNRSKGKCCKKDQHNGHSHKFAGVNCSYYTCKHNIEGPLTFLKKSWLRLSVLQPASLLDEMAQRVIMLI